MFLEASTVRWLIRARVARLPARWIFGAHDRAVHTQILIKERVWSAEACGVLLRKRFPPYSVGITRERHYGITRPVATSLGTRRRSGAAPGPLRSGPADPELRSLQALEARSCSEVVLNHQPCLPNGSKITTAHNRAVEELTKRHPSGVTVASGSAPYAEQTACLVCKLASLALESPSGLEARSPRPNYSFVPNLEGAEQQIAEYAHGLTRERKVRRVTPPAPACRALGRVEPLPVAISGLDLRFPGRSVRRASSGFGVVSADTDTIDRLTSICIAAASESFRRALIPSTG